MKDGNYNYNYNICGGVGSNSSSDSSSCSGGSCRISRRRKETNKFQCIFL